MVVSTRKQAATRKSWNHPMVRSSPENAMNPCGLTEERPYMRWATNNQIIMLHLKETCRMFSLTQSICSTPSTPSFCSAGEPIYYANIPHTVVRPVIHQSFCQPFTRHSGQMFTGQPASHLPDILVSSLLVRPAS